MPAGGGAYAERFLGPERAQDQVPGKKLAVDHVGVDDILARAEQLESTFAGERAQCLEALGAALEIVPQYPRALDHEAARAVFARGEGIVDPRLFNCSIRHKPTARVAEIAIPAAPPERVEMIAPKHEALSAG